MQMNMTPVQNEIFLLIHYILNSEYYRDNFSKPGLKEIFKSAIRQFPENNSENKKTYKKVELYKRHHKISERAAKIIDNYDGEGELYKLLHYEHIVPVSSTILDLLKLGENPSREAVSDVLSETEVIILSKEESNILDGNVEKMYPLEESMVHGKGMKSSGTKAERLSSIDIRIDKRYAKNML
jgi:hypothetical protein